MASRVLSANSRAAARRARGAERREVARVRAAARRTISCGPGTMKPPRCRPSRVDDVERRRRADVDHAAGAAHAVVGADHRQPAIDAEQARVGVAVARRRPHCAAVVTRTMPRPRAGTRPPRRAPRRLSPPATVAATHALDGAARRTAPRASRRRTSRACSAARCGAERAVGAGAPTSRACCRCRRAASRHGHGRPQADVAGVETLARRPSTSTRSAPSASAPRASPSTLPSVCATRTRASRSESSAAQSRGERREARARELGERRRACGRERARQRRLRDGGSPPQRLGEVGDRLARRHVDRRARRRRQREVQSEPGDDVRRPARLGAHLQQQAAELARARCTMSFGHFSCTLGAPSSRSASRDADAQREAERRQVRPASRRTSSRSRT